MKSWSVAALIFLILTCIHALSIVVVSAWSILHLNYFDELENFGFNLIAPITYITSTLFIAAVLYHIKESIWRVVAFVMPALLLILYLAITKAGITDYTIWNVVGYINLVTVIYLTIQSFLIKNQQLSAGFRLFAILTLAESFVNMIIPYVTAKLALPIEYVRYMVLISLFPIAAEIYLLTLIYQYFERNSYQEKFNYKEPL
ncbi:hypothetical protein KHS38_11285 [Mucilaginibacter sp. Bleaf8]|uniref:hypothetical protein n=1 Tax=Mucilaginibacter sp. Bleaf8 TaxID=2834430 RepID=UPI001BCFB3A7|nr:hypothetical protein [Mucilaginibacter sp. Bleaf8]MBS7564987.1 hypothetical protein [Mucilaginibacter sp. Bleaf8]